MKRLYRLVLLFLVMHVSAFAQQAASDASSRLARIADEYWQRQLQSTPYYKLQQGATIDDLPDISQEKAKRDAAFARRLLRELDAVNPSHLSHEDWLTLEILRRRLVQDSQWEKYYWLVFQIAPTISEIPAMQRIFAEHRFRGQDDLDHYLMLLKKCPGFFNDIHRLLQAQARRGIVFPKDGLPMAVGFVSSYMEDPEKSVFFVGPNRLSAIPPERVTIFQRKAAEIIRSEINPSLRLLLDYISGEYSRKAPDAVGLAQYPRGKDYYRFLVRFATTLDISPEEVHGIGLKAVEESEARMAGLRQSLDFKGTRQEFNQYVRTDPRFFPKTPEELEARLNFYLRRVEPIIPSYFSKVPKAPYGVRRLEPRLEGSQALGHYQRPSADEPMGIYYFNGATATHMSLLFAGHLALHELVPGHHFQMSLQAENKSLPEFRHTPAEPAFSEGWGDYSAFLGQEMGVYENAWDLYGMMATDMRKALRLVTDTGINYMGWSRARAFEYMREHSIDSDAYIEAEILGEGVDLPASRLAYKIGSREFIELREKAKRELGDKFDIRWYHQCVLENGSMPLSVLEKHVDWCIARKQQAGRE